MKQRLSFPLFNALICALLGALVGYYLGKLAITILIGGLLGLFTAFLVQWLFSLFGQDNWFFKRRVLLTVLIEIPLAVFIFGPYAFALNQTRANHHAICCETPLDYGAQTYETVQIQADEGITLAGWYVPPVENPGAVIVLLHGAHGDRRGTAQHARVLIESGYGVLMYDQRALGESTGEMTSLSWFDGSDLLAAADYLADRPEVDSGRIGVVGLSLGGHVALNAAHLSPDKFGAMWLDGVQAQQIRDFPQAENAGESFATVINNLILKSVEFRLGQSVPPAYIDILAELEELPLVLVAGGLDDFENRATQKYAAVLNDNAQVWIIEEAPHVGGLSVYPDEYSQRMLTFFEESFEE